jgi:hypothetical protein
MIKNTERRKGEAVVVPIYHFFSMHAYVILDDLLLYFLVRLSFASSMDSNKKYNKRSSRITYACMEKKW